MALVKLLVAWRLWLEALNVAQPEVVPLGVL